MYRFNDRLDKYIRRFSSEVRESDRSRYYKVNSRVIRVSDHLGVKSDGVYHIIIRPNGYILHHPKTGTINIMNYEQVKSFIRTLPFLPSVRFDDLSGPEMLQETGKTVLGVPVSYFTPGQLNVIAATAKKALAEHESNT